MGAARRLRLKGQRLTWRTHLFTTTIPALCRDVRCFRAYVGCYAVRPRVKWLAGLLVYQRLDPIAVPGLTAAMVRRLIFEEMRF